MTSTANPEESAEKQEAESRKEGRFIEQEPLDGAEHLSALGMTKARATGGGQKLESEDPSRYCPVCSQRLESRRCKLICLVCGYYMSCADYY